MESDTFLKYTTHLSKSTKHQNNLLLFALKYISTHVLIQKNITFCFSSFSKSCLKKVKFFTMQQPISQPTYYYSAIYFPKIGSSEMPLQLPGSLLFPFPYTLVVLMQFSIILVIIFYSNHIKQFQ